MHKNSFFNKLNLNNNKQNTRGITLIALVITIIVLLILASVSIAMLTGQNGILTQAQNAKQVTEKSSEKEKLEIAVTGAMALSKNLTVENLKAELANCDIPTQNSKFPVIVNVNNKNFAINSSGDILEYKNMIDITGEETSNTMTKDNLDNYLVVPAGFKILNTSDNVTNGIIIEDTRYENTKGSQFVWIPVGDVIKADKTTVNIKLSRYTFADDSVGTPTDQGSNVINNYFSEINTSPDWNATAKENIESEDSGFRKSAITNYGYYIGRYEARDKDATDARTSSSSTTNQLVCTSDNYVYNYLTQPQAAKLSSEMYHDVSFKSDLMNSYAWDTAILFLQTFDNRTNKPFPYSMQRNLYANLAVKGSGSIVNENEKDIICNIFDMANNCFEWETETSIQPDRGCCMYRGASYGYWSIASLRNDAGYVHDDVSFRPILYL